jgi:hypothetical protein
MKRNILYSLITIILSVFFYYAFIWGSYAVALDESNREDYILWFNVEESGLVTSIKKSYVDKRLVVNCNEYTNNEFSIRFFCSDDLDFNKFIKVGDSVYKPKNSNMYTFYKKDGRKFEKKDEYCPDFPNFAPIEDKYK